MATPIVGFVAYKQHNGDEVDDGMVDEMSCCVASWSCEAIRDGVRHFMQHRGLVHAHINVVMGPVSATRGMMIFIITVGKDDDDDKGGATTTRHSLLPAYLHAENEKRCLPIMWQKKPPSSASIAKTSATTSSSCVGRHVLLIGAGGIGCEVLKVLLLDSLQRWRRGDAKHVARNIVIVDLDDIDATNLNRQFLFTTADIGKSKAETARTSVMRWFHDRSSSSSSHDDVSQYVPNIVAHHGNIKAPHFDESFFGRFHIIINALDNVSARQHVNRMCSAVSVPLVESGTMGYNGQVQPILRGVLECYDCRPTPPDTQTYAVCTIHARPTTMVHCVHFAKELFNALFAGGDDGDDDEEEVGPSSPSLDDAAAANNNNNNTEQVGELTYMRARLRAWRVEQKQRCINNNDNNNDHDELRNLILFGVEVLRHIGVDKINAILAMKSSWGDDGPPVPLPEHVLSSVAAHIEQRWMRMYANGELCLDELPMEGPPSRDESLHLRVAVALFISAMARAVRRSHHHHQHTSFSKDDDVAVDLIAATASLRACNYHIFRPPTTQDGEALSSYSVEDLRTIAGAIVPAIATTNAIIAAAAVQQMHHLMLLAEHNTQQHSEKNCDVGKARMVYVRRQPLQQRRWPPVHSCWLHGTSSSSSSSCRRKRERGGNHLAPITDHLMLHSVLPNLPSPSCHVCQRVPPPHITILCTTTTTTTTTTLSTWCLADFVRACLVEELEMEAPSVMCGAQLIYEEEAFEALGDEPLAHFIANGDVLHLSVDALNHEVGWVVSVRNASTNDDEEQRCSSRAFSIVGLEEAKKAEAAAVAQQQAAPTHEKDGTVDDEDEDAHGVVEIDSDDDEVVEVSQ